MCCSAANDQQQRYHGSDENALHNSPSFFSITIITLPDNLVIK
jgi:hypothetical protein